MILSLTIAIEAISLKIMNSIKERCTHPGSVVLYRQRGIVTKKEVFCMIVTLLKAQI